MCRCGRADEAGDLLQREAAVGVQRDEAVLPLPRGPFDGGESGLGGDSSEHAPHVGRVELGAGPGGEDEVMVVPAGTGRSSDGGLVELPAT